ncbi:MAG: GNAT family N-acetyltransferase [bacterium]|nr:GNAT family N-acetyltransferase [bacterium]
MNDSPTIGRPAYRILTPNLELRCWDPADTAALSELSAGNKDHIARAMSWAASEPTTIDEKLDLIRRWRSLFDRDEEFHYGVFENETGELVGASTMHTRCGPGGLELDYWIDRGHCRRGFATETVAGMTRTAIEAQGASRVEMRSRAGNEAPKRISMKLGFEFEGVLRGRMQEAGDTPCDTESFCLTASRYLESPAATWSIEAYDALRRRLI